MVVDTRIDFEIVMLRNTSKIMLMCMDTFEKNQTCLFNIIFPGRSFEMSYCPFPEAFLILAGWWKLLEMLIQQEVI